VAAVGEKSMAIDMQGSRSRDPRNSKARLDAAAPLRPATRGRRVSAAAPTVADIVKPLPGPANRALQGSRFAVKMRV